MAGPSHIQSFPKIAFRQCGRRQHTDRLAHATPTSAFTSFDMCQVSLNALRFIKPMTAWFQFVSECAGRAASGKSSEATLSQSCKASCKSTHTRGRLAICCAAASAAAPSASATLSELDLVPILNLQVRSHSHAHGYAPRTCLAFARNTLCVTFALNNCWRSQHLLSCLPEIHFIAAIR